MSVSNMPSARLIEFAGARRRDATGPSWPGQSERRIKFRYPLDLTVRFHYADTVAPVYGEGMAINLSSGGVLVASQRQVRVGSLVKLNIEWPFLLDGRIPLQLIAVGRVLRCGTSYFAAAFERHEFRTIKRPIQS
jgi:hypothetical protein